LTGAGVVSFNGRFGTVNPAEGDYTLTQLGDVIITSASNGQLLQYNGSNWVNWTPNYLVGNQAITLSGDATGSGTTSIAVTLANSGVTAGSYGSSTSIPVITVDAKGRVTLVSTATVTTTLAALTDVAISSIANNQLLRYNSTTSKWENWTPNYLTSYTETDTLNSVTGRGNTTTNDITVGSVTAAGLSNLLGQIKTFVSTGNTYIGASPASASDAGYKLDVNGTVRISNDLTMWDDGTNNGNSRALILRALGSTGNVQTGQITLDGFGASGQDYLQLSASNIRLAPTSGTVTISGTTPSISTVAASGFRLTANSTTNGFIFTQAYNQTSGDLFAVFTNSNQKKFSIAASDSSVTIASLAGTGSRMIVADANGVLSTQAIPTSAVSSVFGRTGAVVAANGDYTTSQVTEGSNLYYTDARARAAITLTTTGSSGAATYSGGTLNIPTYTLAGLGGQPALSGTGFVKISGTTISYDNSTYLTTSSAASTYLPLAGGTLTGALNGTSATFSGTIEAPLFFANAGGSLFLQSASDAITIRQNTTSNNLTIKFNRSGVNLWGIQTVPNGANEDFRIYNYQNSTSPFTIASTGAATFSSSVTANGGVRTTNANGYSDTDGTSTIWVSANWTASQPAIAVTTNHPLTFWTNSVKQMTLSASGNLGLGVTPSAWADYRVLQLGGGSISSYVDNNFFEVNQNAFWNGSYKYVNNGFASRYQQNAGRHEWYNAPSGTAGNAISFTQAMMLDAIGRLGIGRTDISKRLDIYDANTLGTDDIVRAYQNLTYNHAFYRSQRNGGANMLIGATRDNVDGNISANVSMVWNASNHDMVFGTNGTERARITAGGNFVIGGTVASNVGLTIYGTNAATIYQTPGTGTGAGNGFYVGHTGDISYVWNYNNYPTVFGTNNTQRFVIGADGNLAMGSFSPSGTPPGDYRSFEIGRQGNTISAAPWKSNLYLSTNATITAGSTTFTYRNSGVVASFFSLEGGDMTFSNAASGTAGNTISFTERFKVTSEGAIKTGEPDTGWGRAAIKIGASVSGAAFNVTRYLPVSVDGTIYYINLNSSTP